MNPPERVSITAERVDDYADRRYLITAVLTVPAESMGQALSSVVGVLEDLIG